MLARVGLDEKHAPGDDTQAPDDNARLKARRRSVLFWWADCPRCTSASLCWGVESETAGGPARRRVGRSGDEGGLGESVPLSLESENLSPNSRPPPIVDPAAVTMCHAGRRFVASASAAACVPIPTTGPPWNARKRPVDNRTPLPLGCLAPHGDKPSCSCSLHLRRSVDFAANFVGAGVEACSLGGRLARVALFVAR